jgi:hypothetical protein
MPSPSSVVVLLQTSLKKSYKKNTRAIDVVIFFSNGVATKSYHRFLRSSLCLTIRR